MNSAGDELFARAGLAQQEHSRISAGHGFDHLQHTAKYRTASNNSVEAGLRVHWFVDSVEIKRDLRIDPWPPALLVQRIRESIETHCVAPFCEVCPSRSFTAFGVSSARFSSNPFTDVRRTILELDAVRFAISQKLDCIAVYECYVFQIQGDVAASPFQLKEPTQFVNVLCLDSTA